jgi:hypothetical protein
MRLFEIEGSPFEPFDFDPQKTRRLFDLELKANRGNLTPEEKREFHLWLFRNKRNYLKLYHGTSTEHDIMSQGLKPTSSRTAKSLQSGHGNVYLTYDPQRAVGFARMAYPGKAPYVVYSVIVPISKCKVDADQLRNKRQWGAEDRAKDIGDTLADSLLYGGGVCYKGKIDRSQVTIHGWFDAEGREVPYPRKFTD